MSAFTIAWVLITRLIATADSLGIRTRPVTGSFTESIRFRLASAYRELRLLSLSRAAASTVSNASSVRGNGLGMSSAVKCS